MSSTQEPQHIAQQADTARTTRPSAANTPQDLTDVEKESAAIDPAVEKKLWQGRTSWKHFIGLLALGLGWFTVAVIVGFSSGGWLGWAMFILCLLLWLYVIGKILVSVFSQHYRLTTQRIFIERGLLSKTIDQTELMRVDDVRIHKSFFDRLMGLGSVQIITTDSSDREIKIMGVEEPEKIADFVRQNMRLMRRKSLFVENL